MTEETQSWKVGEARVTSIVEAENSGIPPLFFFPAATPEAMLGHEWAAPLYVDAEGNVGLRVQAYVVETGGRTVVVDPCIGNGRKRMMPFWNEQTWPFMERFRAAGFDPADVDLVVYTHLHVDHVGWSTHWAGDRWAPTFPQARHLFVTPELEYFRALPEGDNPAIEEDTIAPIFDAGLADMVEIDADLGLGLRLEPTVGHTPGHASLWIESGGETALVTGDFIHHPVQCSDPSLSFVSDADSAQAERTRRAMLGRLGTEGHLTFGTHFATAPVGHVVPTGDAWTFRALDA
jgi:glyoxylase-like metal-dependent hydrolase (beta-lactamase superfamily II)